MRLARTRFTTSELDCQSRALFGPNGLAKLAFYGMCSVPTPVQRHASSADHVVDVTGLPHPDVSELKLSDIGRIVSLELAGGAAFGSEPRDGSAPLLQNS